MIELAKQELEGPIQLWTFQSNAGARRFYARHGFAEVEQTNGDNEEQAPRRPPALHALTSQLRNSPAKTSARSNGR